MIADLPGERPGTISTFNLVARVSFNESGRKMKLLKDAGLFFEQAGCSPRLMLAVGRFLMYLALGFGVLLGLSLIFRPLVVDDHPYSAACLSNIKQIGIAIVMYEADFDDHYPRVGPWMDEILPDMKSEDMFRCPQAPSKPGEGKKVYGYAMNRPLAGRDASHIKQPATAIVLFDSANLERNVMGGPSLLPKPGRHVSRENGPGNNVGYADTHSKWRPERQEWSREP